MKALMKSNGGSRGASGAQLDSILGGSRPLEDGERLLSTIMCAKCRRPVEGWSHWREPDAAGFRPVVCVEVRCHGAKETRRIDVDALDRARRSGEVVGGVAFDRVGEIEPRMRLYSNQD